MLDKPGMYDCDTAAQNALRLLDSQMVKSELKLPCSSWSRFSPKESQPGIHKKRRVHLKNTGSI